MQRLISSALIFLSVFLILTLSGCRDNPPVVEKCVFGKDDDGVYDWVCLNPEIEKEPRIEELDYGVNHICVSPEGYRIYEQWVTDKLKELEQCQSKSY